MAFLVMNIEYSLGIDDETGSARSLEDILSIDLSSM